MLDKYEILKILTVIAGKLGHFMVWMGLLSGCILTWYFIFKFIKTI